MTTQTGSHLEVGGAMHATPTPQVTASAGSVPSEEDPASTQNNDQDYPQINEARTNRNRTHLSSHLVPNPYISDTIQIFTLRIRDRATRTWSPAKIIHQQVPVSTDEAMHSALLQHRAILATNIKITAVRGWRMHWDRLLDTHKDIPFLARAWNRRHAWIEYGEQAEKNAWSIECSASPQITIFAGPNPGKTSLSRISGVIVNVFDVPRQEDLLRIDMMDHETRKKNLALMLGVNVDEIERERAELLADYQLELGLMGENLR